VGCTLDIAIERAVVVLTQTLIALAHSQWSHGDFDVDEHPSWLVHNTGGRL
jgi:hypothetical protein